MTTTCDRCGNTNASLDESGVWCRCNDLTDAQIEREQLDAEARMDARIEEAQLRVLTQGMDWILNRPR